ncbi:DEAD/DEAH box helicase family protein [Staphylococcus epidermidis]|uniref:DEAD/DEAH box helicase family protein n=1 Tax=Staphylococcus epidermidis TaxID=1282 RepID=UPI002005DCC9|nr:DEAD/DEAH box helicase family protein [Staphylococcus epidermidis]MCG1254052.1 DEAD/DEAH box helicase family protein [Staphylococcus epidermidis]MCG1406159.1 DEAD/DEAH box helicase family protein [Staphylococcus epidermidis]MCG1410786.1 DEAD/DEAH box helicase family protein [Staphylococcus epidermidis]MCG1413147.1 DEAD/DEAH box helicase family protein [Staphylococcus epidermidis]MCG1911326.1 DEAD/DEAH box helicase family protein [Staphylococcus epidermidis]
MSEMLHDRIENQLFLQYTEIPNYIIDNLNHRLRSYQEEALQRLMYVENQDNGNLYNKLMFNMATGSGKTLVLAASILYLFKEKGYQNFLFFVNSTAIVNKTYDNLTNTASNKYLFNPNGIVIDGKTISIQVVDNYPSLPDENTIYLKLTTINSLHDKLNYPRENEITYEDLAQLPLVLLADEAHHLNVSTKKKGKKSKVEIEETNWEVTVERIMKQNNSNKLLEFTATVQLKDDIFEKYKDRILYRYDLKEFMHQGYSKNVTLLHASEENELKIVHALLMSEYKKYVAEKNDIILKPVIMFQSTTIKGSQELHQIMLDYLEQLTLEQLEKIVEAGYKFYTGQNSIWGKVFSFYKQSNLIKVLDDLNWNFNKQTTLNVNNDKEKEKNAQLLNNLEDFNNPIRAIFAVYKLNEGWDVLNLFDIVKIDEKKKVNKAATNAEAQLIGRGARYYPFIYNQEKSYKRRFDNEFSDLKVIETLHYHTINDSSYIKNLHQSLTEAKVQTNADISKVHKGKVKSKFKKTELFKNGKIYINKTIPTTPEDYKSLENYSATRTHQKDLYKTSELNLTQDIKRIAENRKEVKLSLSKPLLQKALRSNPFFRYSNLKEYVPSITSVQTFIESKDFLGNLDISVTIPRDMDVSDITPKIKLSVLNDYLSKLETKIKSNYLKVKGTTIFEGIKISELIDDYVVEVNNVNRDVESQKRPKNMNQHDWYIYDKAIVNGLERDLIDLINNMMEDLQKKYDEVYLIRNERKIKFREIDGVKGFMPDFLLYLKDDNYTYQVFVEPKGKHLLLNDEWKEQFMLSINKREDIEVLAENDNVRLVGLCFYSDDALKRQEFKEQLNDKLLS